MRVPAFDLLEDGETHRRLGREAMAIEQLAFERGKEALGLIAEARSHLKPSPDVHSRSRRSLYSGSPPGPGAAMFPIGTKSTRPIGIDQPPGTAIAPFSFPVPEVFT